MSPCYVALLGPYVIGYCTWLAHAAICWRAGVAHLLRLWSVHVNRSPLVNGCSQNFVLVLPELRDCENDEYLEAL